MTSDPSESNPGGDGQETTPFATLSKPHWCNRIALIAFCLALLLLGLSVILMIAAICNSHALDMWAPHGGPDPILAFLAGIFFAGAMIANATAFSASLWGLWKRKSKLLSHLAPSVVCEECGLQF